MVPNMSHAWTKQQEEGYPTQPEGFGIADQAWNMLGKVTMSHDPWPKQQEDIILT